VTNRVVVVVLLIVTKDVSDDDANIGCDRQQVSYLRISPRVAFQGSASGRPRANQNQSIK